MFYLETQQTQTHVSNLNSVTIQEFYQTIQRAIRNFSHKLKQSTNSNKLSSKFPKPQSTTPTNIHLLILLSQESAKKVVSLLKHLQFRFMVTTNRTPYKYLLMEVTRYHIKSTERYLNRLLPWSSF